MMNGLHVMVDIEALGNPDLGSGGVIASVGATAWYRGPLPKGDDLVPPDFKVMVNVSNQPGRTIDGKTVLWWMRQTKEAQDATFGKGLARLGIREMLVAFYNWAEHADHFWAWPAAYDLSTLDHAYKQCGVSAPWSGRRRALHCARTLCNALSVKRHPNLLKHDPLVDAQVQADAVMEALVLVATYEGKDWDK